MLYVELVNADYVNSTMSSVRMIGDDFLDFQKTGKRVGGRDGRRLISFETKNDNIQVTWIGNTDLSKGNLKIDSININRMDRIQSTEFDRITIVFAWT